jgi:ribulose 1,5-bisphosphate synthetase/thiazole synthase
MSRNIITYKREIPFSTTDVLVVGGGPAGIAASIASARNGAKTTLVEQYGFLGGMATAGLVGPFMTSYSLDGKEQIIRGIFEELVIRMEKMGGAIHPSKVAAGTPYSAYLVYGHNHVTPFESEILKVATFEMMEEAGVKLLLHTYFVDTIVDEGEIKKVIVVNKSGLQAIEAKIVVDCTGDADVAYSSGVPFTKGRGKDGLTQPVSMFFRIRNIDTEEVERYMAKHTPKEVSAETKYERPFQAIVEEAKKSGEFPLERDAVLLFATPKKGEALINVSRIHNIDPTNAEDLVKAEIEGRRQVMFLIDFFKKNIPGLKNIELSEVAPQIGIRESRHIVGDYIITQEDVLDSKEFDDVVALCSFPIDIHNVVATKGRFEGVRNNRYYEIPYRTLTPMKINNLLIGGRPISATHEAAGSLRVMPPAFATGQAAGTAAALAAKKGITPRQLDYKELQRTLIPQNVVLPKRITG